MRKILLVALLCLAFAQLRAQNGVVFKIKYLPNKNYQMTINVGMKVNATLSGDSAIIKMLSSKGITQPILANLNMTMAGNMQTGAVGADKSFPLNMDYKISNLTASANGKQAPIPASATAKDFKVSAHVTSDGQFRIDSASGKKVNDTTEKSMKQMMDMIQKEIKFPDKPMKLGDTFTQGGPMNIPLDGKNNIQIDAAVTYKLVSISDGKAFFDMTPNINMSFSLKGATVTVSGSGTGKMVYSIKNNFPLTKDGTFDIKIKVTSDKINVDGTAVFTTSTNCTIN